MSSLLHQTGGVTWDQEGCRCSCKVTVTRTSSVLQCQEQLSSEVCGVGRLRLLRTVCVAGAGKEGSCLPTWLPAQVQVCMGVCTCVCTLT